MVEILARHSGQSIERVQKDTDRDHWMSAEEAVAYGLVDGILAPSQVPVGLTGPAATSS
jgi:ATP-dependent Clp protease protease subunit